MNQTLLQVVHKMTKNLTRYHLNMLIIGLLASIAISCSDNDDDGGGDTPELQVFAGCVDQNFEITEPNSTPWTPNAITLVAEEIADNVFAVYDERGANPDLNNYPALATSAGFVIGSESVFMIESMANRQLLCQVYDLIRAETDLPILYVGNTNEHFDHSFGNSYINDEVQIVQHQHTVEEIANDFQSEEEFAVTFWGDDQGIQDANPEAADIVVPDEGWEVDLGGVTLEAKYFGNAQTGGELFFYLPAERVVWTGNSILSEAPGIPWLLDSGAEEILQTMKDVRAFLPDDVIIVPGHDRPVKGANTFDFTIDYLTTLIAEVRSNIAAGNDLGTTQSAIVMDDFQGYSLWGFAHTNINVPNTFNELQ